MVSSAAEKIGDQMLDVTKILHEAFPAQRELLIDCRSFVVEICSCRRRVYGVVETSGSVGFGSSRFHLTKYRAFSVHSISGARTHNRFNYRQIVRPNGKRAFLVDTLALLRGLEAQGVPSKQAEVITSAITEVLNDSLENVAHSFVSKAEMQKEHHFSRRETEKFRGDMENMCSELRYEIDKVTAGQRLDLNLERGHIRDELANQNAETTNLTNKLDREIHALRAQLEAAKCDVIKYCIGTLVSISAVGLAVVRILM